ncbi:FAD-dependent monooxygenase [Mucilaginibacter segetis]|uniref:FAD-dependent monooxygenase n=1 Tax=Mucilaginibacter segetis TaxID=2793071 RepID=A0A934UL12_9SPHI|nr:FAD-dependent monooxygenase [Mucilaginibacter segetis]MBK0378038.1 FAD-dependent monooxygenase [Mucilaginibacter segetis]
MLALPSETKVLIVGAGPSGLMMAAQLLRYGIQPLIIDGKQGPTNHSKALAVQARSLEIYRQMGIVEGALTDGKPAEGAEVNLQGKHTADLLLGKAGEGGTKYPYILMYPQNKNERLLLDFLTLKCCTVYWNTTLTEIKQLKNGAQAQLQNNGNNYQVNCEWIIGADGAHSVVRKQLGIAFVGDTYQHKFYLADIKLDKGFDDNLVHLFMAKRGFAGFFLMPENSSYRIVGNLPPDISEEEVQLSDVMPHLRSIVGSDLAITNVNWFTVYKLHHRMAEKFNDQRCFLIGDAAHIHSPVGGQGMNTGLQDAYNLAWKLAGVINGQLMPVVLNSYGAERIPVAKDLLNSTDKVFNIVISQSWLSNTLKQFVLPIALKFLWGKKQFRKRFFKRVSQIGINYRESNINLHLSAGTVIKAGDRMPYLPVYDEKKQQYTDIHTWCSKPGFTLITLGDVKEGYLFTLAKWITQNYPTDFNFFHMPRSEKNAIVFDTFEVRAGERRAIIVRPDMHIGYINDIIDIELMNNYLHQIAKFV